jgi:hypothetical protein
MTEEEREEYNTELRLYAGIALPGIITTMGGTVFIEKEIARHAFDLAEAMIVESKKREKTNECNSSSDS